MPLLNYTTKVNAQKTVTEVMDLLVAKGAYRWTRPVSASSWARTRPRLAHSPPRTFCPRSP